MLQCVCVEGVTHDSGFELIYWGGVGGGEGVMR